MSNNPVKIGRNPAGTRIAVKSPYNAAFVAAAKDLGGKWSAGAEAWTFDARDEDAVRAACMEYYGSDGRTADLVTIRVTYTRETGEYTGPLAIAGRAVARAFGRDSGAKLADGVRLEAGRFTSGGSMKNWKTIADAGTVALVRDFPRAAAEALAAEGADEYGVTVEIVDEAQPVDRDALAAERERLMARIAEIDAALAAE